LLTGIPVTASNLDRRIRASLSDAAITWSFTPSATGSRIANPRPPGSMPTTSPASGNACGWFAPWAAAPDAAPAPVTASMPAAGSIAADLAIASVFNPSPLSGESQ
jgi:hypothetical protein